MDAAVGTRCVLFTDLVSSTELRVRVGEDRADAVQHAHDALVAGAIAACHGTVVKYLGDGVLATFESAADGVAAAIGVQQAVAAHGDLTPEAAFEVRIGLSVGDVAVEAGDVLGTAVVEAARLCATANGGEILVADIVRALARGRGGFAFESVGNLELKGLPEPVAACTVAWSPAEEADGAVPLPALLLGTASVDYVGREDVLARMTGCWASVRRAGSAAVLVSGEPGIGKTRTSAEVARLAHRDGALVLYGRCEEELNLPYQPFLEALDHYVRHVSSPELGRLRGELTRLLPDLPETVPGIETPLASDPRTEEHRLLSAVASWLVEASRAHGLVLVLDDLHWATRPTLLMLTHAVREAAATDGSRLLVIGTLRDSDLDPDHPFSEALAELARVDAVHRVSLRGLSDGETARFLEHAAGHELGEDGQALARRLHTETEGNPFFVGEVLRHLIETGGVRREDGRWVVPDVHRLSVPEGVRDVIMRRLTRLGEDTRQVLTVAAVVGRDIDVDVLCAVADHGEDVVIDALDDALRARLVEETGADHYRFSHALVRATLYDQLSATRRRRVHRRTASALEKLRPDDVSALAHHFVEGGPEHDDDHRAVRYTLAAAQQSLVARALSEAEVRYRAALELLDDGEHAAPAARLDALIGLGLSLREQGNPEFREVLLEASRRAHVLGDVERHVLAVMANSRGVGSVVGGRDVERVTEIEAALTALGEEPSPDRSRLLARLAAELATGLEVLRARELAVEALSMAEQFDRDVQSEVLYVAAPPALAELGAHAMLPELRDLVAWSDERGSPTERVWSRLHLSAATLTLAELEESNRVREEACAIADEDALPVLQWAAHTFRMLRFVSTGRLEEAEAEVNFGFDRGQAGREPDAISWWGAAYFGVCIYTIGVGDLTEAALGFVEQFPESEIWKSAHLLCLVESEGAQEARERLAAWGPDVELLCAGIWGPLPAAQLAHVAWRLGDVALAAAATPHLTGHEGEFAHTWITVFGPVDTCLGMTLALQGREEEAVAAIERGVALCECVGAPLFAAWSQWVLTVELVRQGTPASLAKAVRVRAEALARTEQFGAHHLSDLLRQVDVTGATAPTSYGEPALPAQRGPRGQVAPPSIM